MASFILFCACCVGIWAAWSAWSDNKKVDAIVRSDASNHEKIDELIEHFGQKNYSVISRTENQVQLTRKKTFSFLWAFLWLLFFGIGLVVYIIYYMSKRDDIRTFTFPQPKLKVVSPE